MATADKTDGWIHASYWKYLAIGSGSVHSKIDYRPSQLAFESLNPGTEVISELELGLPIGAEQACQRSLRLDADCVDHLLEQTELFEEIEFFCNVPLADSRVELTVTSEGLESTVLAEIEAIDAMIVAPKDGGSDQAPKEIYRPAAASDLALFEI